MAALPELAEDASEVRKILDDPAVGHRTAARKINEFMGGVLTTERSVRRYRAKTRSAESLADPNPPGILPPIKGSGGQWHPGIDIDPREGGEFRTAPRPVSREAPETEPTEAELLAEFNLDPAVWEVVSARKSQWQGGPGGTWLEARRVSFRRRDAVLDEADVESLFRPYYPVPYPGEVVRQNKPDRIVMVPAGDLQLGKADGGGTAATIERFCRLTDEIGNRILTEDTGRRGSTSLILPWLGDCIEGIVSQKGRLIASLDVTLTEQVRIYRRLMMHQIAVLAPKAARVVIPVVPGNHDETTRAQQMPVTDSWAIEGASAVADWMAGRPEYSHVEFVFPEPGEFGITLNVGSVKNPFTMAFTHGHVATSPAGVIPWWKGQAYGRQHAGQADMLVSAHFHHFRMEHTGGRRTWLQIPALDGGSDWYRSRSGEDAFTGMVTVEITPGLGQGWKGLTVHS